jgi:dsRNA-specific ribonuclease
MNKIQEMDDNSLFNNCNIEITQEDVLKLFETYGLPKQLFNIRIYKRAFIHKSYTHMEGKDTSTHRFLKSKSNERLEFLGDGILELVTKFYLYRRFPNENEGFMTEKKIALIKNEAIGKIAYDMGLHKWLIISKNTEEKNIRNNYKKLGCLFEAFIGAIFLDYNRIELKHEESWFQQLYTVGPGFQVAQRFIENVFERHVDWSNIIQNDDNYKNILQVKIQKEFKVTPLYLELGYDLITGFQIHVFLNVNFPIRDEDIISQSLTCPYNTVNDFTSYDDIHEKISEEGRILIFLGCGNHKIKRKAQQIACKNAIECLEKFV